ncbi:MAG TPA: hypothetical protein VNN22_11560 [Verrucomicrobiae bacterium]|nr:hypothetical protein [Verrucomicrobiae bacterium]
MLIDGCPEGSSDAQMQSPNISKAAASRIPYGIWIFKRVHFPKIESGGLNLIMAK